MSQRLKPKRSNVVGKIPTTTDLEIGEIAVNMADKKIFVHEPGGTVVDLTEKADLTGYALESWTNTRIVDELTAGDYATNTALGNVTSNLGTMSSENTADYSTTTEMNAAITAASPTGYNNTDWDTAFSWGDHSGAGYLTAHQDITGKADITYVDTAVAGIVDTAPEALDTLNELATALGNDANFSTTISTQIGTKWTEDAAKIANWDAAFGYGDHAAAGYLTAHQDISGKADAATTYTKTEVDAADALKADVATTYTKTEVDALIPTVPTDVSAFNNDSGYLTAHQDISSKADVATTYTKTEVDALIPAAYGDTEVNGHLNQSSAGPNQMLIWTGGDYDWIDQPTGGTGGGTSDQFIEGGHSATIYGIDDLVIDAGGSA